MSRRCQLTGKGPSTGNNVSHAHNKTRRRFLANLQQCTLRSETLGRAVRMRISTRALRTITKNGGLDAYLARTPERELTEEGVRLKRQIGKAARHKKAAPAAG